MKNAQALLFDIDSTLLDTAEIIFQTFEYTLLKHLNKRPNRELELKSLFGKSLIECYESLVPGADIGELSKTHNAFQQAHTELVKPFKNAVTTLHKLKAQNYKIAAITNRERFYSQKFIKNAGLEPYLELIIGTEDVQTPKPHPEGIHKALKHFDIAPANAYMIGDSEFDIYAGQRAGTKTIGVTTGFHPDTMKATNPNFIIDDLAEMIELLREQRKME